MPPIGNTTCQSSNGTTADSTNIGKDDRNALLYIVVTLLFYSMGIIIGIITYLKREQAEMEEDKMFDMYMQLKREPFNLYKRERVQQMALYLKQLEEQQAAREKIESWRTLEQSQLHVHRVQPCRRHNHRHASCPDCNKASSIPEICHGYGDAAALGISESGWKEGRGGTALLCSLTLGVCEPLLTPESMKRVMLPDMANAESKPTAAGLPGVSALRPYPYVPDKRAFRHNSLSVPSSDFGLSLIRETSMDQNHGDQFQLVSVRTMPPHETDIDSLAMFTKGDIELTDMKQINTNKNYEMLYNNSTADEESENICDNSAFNHAQIIPRSCKRSSSVTTTSGKFPALPRQLSVDTAIKPADPLMHDLRGNNFQENTVSNSGNKLILKEKLIDEDGLLISPRTATCAPSEDTMENLISVNKKSVDECGNTQERFQQHQKRNQEQGTQSPPASSLSSATLPTTGSRPSHKFELPLHLLLLAQQQLQQPSLGDVKPKVFVPLSNIPQSIMKNELVGMSASSPIGTSPPSTRRLQSPLYDTRKKSHPHSVDIADVTSARKLGLNWKSKTADKKGAARSQPERRGALFFTQRSLQKDTDSPKSLGGRKQSRPMFTWQESVDSHHSRASDASENIESPLLQPNNDVENGLTLSSPSSSAGSNSMSPLGTTKHTRSIPRLVRSQTEENPKVLPK